MMNILKNTFERMNHFKLGRLIVTRASMEAIDGETVLEREYEIYGKIEDLKALAEGATKAEKQEQWGIPLTLGGVNGNIRVRRTEIMGGEDGVAEGTVLNLTDDESQEDSDPADGLVEDETPGADDLVEEGEEELDEEGERSDEDETPEETLDEEESEEEEFDLEEGGEESSGEEDLDLEEEESSDESDLGDDDEGEKTEQSEEGDNVTYTQTIKVKQDDGSQENEMEISKETFDIFKSMVPNGLIKTRYFYPVKGTDLTLEVDVFEDMNGVQYPIVKIDLEVEEGQDIEEVTLPFKIAEDSIRVMKPGHKSEEDLEYVRTLFKRHYEVSNPLHKAEQ